MPELGWSQVILGSSRQIWQIFSWFYHAKASPTTEDEPMRLRGCGESWHGALQYF